MRIAAAAAAAVVLAFAAGVHAKEEAKPATPAAKSEGAKPADAAKGAVPKLPAKAGAIVAPPGTYKLDPNHTSLEAKVLHLGIAKYAVRFTKYEATIELDPKNLAKSSVTVTIDPMSVDTDYTGDYKAGHKDSPYQTFEEALAKDAKFFNAGQFPTITFKSTKVVPKGTGRMRITGDLTFLGQTRPVTLDATVVGSMEKHPFTGRGVIGFAATGEFKRSEWGMVGTQQFLGDTVSLEFDGEFQQAAPDEPAPKPAT